MKKFKVYKIEDGEAFWYAARNTIEVLKAYLSQQELKLDDLDDVNITEEPFEKWKDRMVKDEDGVDCYTFQEFMNEKRTEPELIASTCY